MLKGFLEKQFKKFKSCMNYGLTGICLKNSW